MGSRREVAGVRPYEDGMACLQMEKKNPEEAKNASMKERKSCLKAPFGPCTPVKNRLTVREKATLGAKKLEMGGRTDEAFCTDLEETGGELCGAGEATLYEYAYALNTNKRRSSMARLFRLCSTHPRAKTTGATRALICHSGGATGRDNSGDSVDAALANINS